jgi:hypothetical protein
MTIALRLRERAIDVPEERREPGRGTHDRSTRTRAAFDDTVGARRLCIGRPAGESAQRAQGEIRANQTQQNVVRRND